MKGASIRTFAQVAALVLTLGAALFLARGIAELATTKYDYNLDVVKSLAGQASDTEVGTLLLLLAFALQLGTALRPARWVDFDVRRSAVVAGVVFSVGLCVLGYLGASVQAKRIETQVTRILDQRLRSPR
jgi:hypothetical protein